MKGISKIRDFVLYYGSAVLFWLIFHDQCISQSIVGIVISGILASFYSSILIFTTILELLEWKEK